MSVTKRGARPAAVTEFGPMNVVSPTTLGRTTIGRANRTIPPRARKPARPTAHSPGAPSASPRARAERAAGHRRAITAPG